MLAGLETRYLSDWSMNTLNIAGLSGDKLYDPDNAGMLGSDSPLSEDRWFLGFEHYGSLGRNWSTFVDYNAVSDRDYFYDLGSNGLNLTSRTHLNRQGRIDYSSDLLRAGINVQRIDIIDPFFSTSNLTNHLIAYLNFKLNLVQISGVVSDWRLKPNILLLIES